ncbi:MAG: divalent-cation tolerance protein CutA [Balneolaceae bacterium]
MFKNLRLVYIITRDRQEARTLGKMIIEKRLAACVNIIDGMESMYHWKGEVVSENECILIAKTPYHNIDELTQVVKEHHGYECPCIVTLTLTEQEGNEDYLLWLLKESRHPDPDKDISEK